MKHHLQSLCIASVVILLLGATACSKSQPPEDVQSGKVNLPLHVHAAAGARLVTDDICDRYTQLTGVSVERNYASSGTLARQIAAGAQADLFVSANKQWIDFLNEKQLLDKTAIAVAAKNALVVIAPKDAQVAPLHFVADYDIGAGIDHIAVGDPAYVPVGKYTDQVFKNLSWKDKLDGKLILAKDVSSVLNYVALGECQLGVVYRSEALISDKVKIVADVPEALHAPIVFYVAAVKSASAANSVRRLYESFLNDGQAVFKKYGFSLP
ncbi:MAG: molybdate ABC transporter substrate-binding protein [Deltaproteobacteria bacterium]|nr:molybdate ABC transporter substrate-binding protein [Deltaproteobacteria bacterium]